MQLLMQCKYLTFWLQSKDYQNELPIPAIRVKDRKTGKFTCLWTGKQLISMFLPRHFYFKHHAEITAMELSRSQQKNKKKKNSKEDYKQELEENSKDHSKCEDCTELLFDMTHFDDPGLSLVINGELLLGTLRKGNFGTSSESMIQKCCLDFGSDYTMKLLSRFSANCILFLV